MRRFIGFGVVCSFVSFGFIAIAQNAVPADPIPAEYIPQDLSSNGYHGRHYSDGLHLAQIEASYGKPLFYAGLAQLAQW